MVKNIFWSLYFVLFSTIGQTNSCKTWDVVWATDRRAEDAYISKQLLESVPTNPERFHGEKKGLQVLDCSIVVLRTGGGQEPKTEEEKKAHKENNVLFEHLALRGTRFVLLDISSEPVGCSNQLYQLGIPIIRNLWEERCTQIAHVLTIPLGVTGGKPKGTEKGLSRVKEKDYIWSMQVNDPGKLSGEAKTFMEAFKTLTKFGSYKLHATGDLEALCSSILTLCPKKTHSSESSEIQQLREALECGAIPVVSQPSFDLYRKMLPRAVSDQFLIVVDPKDMSNVIELLSNPTEIEKRRVRLHAAYNSYLAAWKYKLLGFLVANGREEFEKSDLKDINPAQPTPINQQLGPKCQHFLNSLRGPVALKDRFCSPIKEKQLSSLCDLSLMKTKTCKGVLITSQGGVGSSAFDGLLATLIRKYNMDVGPGISHIQINSKIDRDGFKHLSPLCYLKNKLYNGRFILPYNLVHEQGILNCTEESPMAPVDHLYCVSRILVIVGEPLHAIESTMRRFRNGHVNKLRSGTGLNLLSDDKTVIDEMELMDEVNYDISGMSQYIHDWIRVQQTMGDKFPPIKIVTTKNMYEDFDQILDYLEIPRKYSTLKSHEYEPHYISDELSALIHKKKNILDIMRPVQDCIAELDGSVNKSRFFKNWKLPRKNFFTSNGG